MEYKLISCEPKIIFLVSIKNIRSLEKELEELKNQKKNKEKEIKNLSNKYSLDSAKLARKTRYPTLVVYAALLYFADYLRGNTEDWTFIFLLFIVGPIVLLFLSFASRVVGNTERSIESEKEEINEEIESLDCKISSVRSSLKEANLEYINDKDKRRRENEWWESLTPREFEEEIAEMYEFMGYETTVTDPSGDGGYDVIARSDDGDTCLIECKQWNSGTKVGRPIVQQLMGAVQGADADYGVVVTTSDFTDSAQNFAEKAGVRLINGTELVGLR